MKIEELKGQGEVLYIDSGNSEAVKSAQRYLNEHGYTDAYGNKLSEDGDYGKNTFNAVIKYQQANNLTADGKIGDETWNHMWSNYGGTGNTSEHNRYAEREYNLGGMTVQKENNKQSASKQSGYGSGIDNLMKAAGAAGKYYGCGINYNKPIYSPDGYVERAENENAKRNREEPITGVQDPYDMASQAQNYSDSMEWIYQKNRLSK